MAVLCRGAATIQNSLGIGGAGDSMGSVKAQIASRRIEAFNRIELFVVIGAVVFLAVTILLPALLAPTRHPSRIACINNVKQVSLCFKTWEGDNLDKFPMQFARTNSETMKSISNGRAYVLWQTMSNELGTPRVLRCPNDNGSTYATNFTTGFSDANISFFCGLDTVDDTHPKMILMGDDNLAVNGVRVKPGVLNLPVQGSLTWTKERHGGTGNVGMADSSVLQTTPATLNTVVINATNGAPFTTYRWVIP